LNYFCNVNCNVLGWDLCYNYVRNCHAVE
jgi:hypothetical protein